MDNLFHSEKYVRLQKLKRRLKVILVYLHTGSTVDKTDTDKTDKRVEK